MGGGAGLKMLAPAPTFQLNQTLLTFQFLANILIIQLSPPPHTHTFQLFGPSPVRILIESHPTHTFFDGIALGEEISKEGPLDTNVCSYT